MSTEYRRGIPSTAHVEAATRLGLLWHRRGRDAEHRTRFVVENGQVLSDYGEEGNSLLALGPVTNNERHYAYYCIHPDGTPVDWEVLDQEAARVGQPDCEECAGTGRVDSPTHEGSIACSLCSGTGTLRQPATVTPTTPTTQPQGFRADLWARLNEWITANWLNTLGDIEVINDRGISGLGYDRRYSWDELGLDTETDEADRQALIARWTVYQELKPLYDLVDGAQGEAAMPRDVYNECRARAGWRGEADDRWLLRYNSRLEAVGIGEVWHGDGCTLFERANMRNFAVVLDAVAERRVAERMRGQTPTVTSAQPEPRRFADVRPDRHGWRWWRLTGRVSTDLGQRFETQDGRCRWRSAHADAWFVPDTANPQMLRYTVIPTDEQGNPVSWESIGLTDPTEIRLTSASGTPDRHGTRRAAPEGFFSAEPQTPPRPNQFSNNPSTPPLTPEGLLSAMQNYTVPGIHATVGTGAKPAQTETVSTLPLPFPRFTVDELDDVDHSKTTKLDEVTLRRGKLPTVEQIAKYREVRARRTGGTVADALKESRIDCEVAQYVLERWAGGLGDADTVLLLQATGCMPVTCVPVTPSQSFRRFDTTQGEVDQRSQDFLRTHNPTLDTSEKPSPTVQRERQEAEERRQRLAELRQRLAAERAAQPTEKEPTPTSRFDLIEPDPQADPTASIRAWEVRQAAAKVRPVAAPPRIAKPAAAPRRPTIEVVDAEVDGLSRSEVFAALFGRALNGGC